MPFITEALWQALDNRVEGESIMISRMPVKETVDETLLKNFDFVKEIISGIRTIRLQKNIPNKEALNLEVKEKNSDYNLSLEPIILKMANISSIKEVSEKDPMASSFLAGTTEFSIPLGNNINIEEEIKKLEEEFIYYEGFLNSVMKKLGNEKFLANAKAEIVEAERKKKADAESKLQTIKKSIEKLKE